MTNRKKNKIYNKQKAIVELLNKIGWDGLEETFITDYTTDKNLKYIDDKTLTKLAKKYIQATAELNKYLDILSITQNQDSLERE